jgi:hypothetical protein
LNLLLAINLIIPVLDINNIFIIMIIIIVKINNIIINIVICFYAEITVIFKMIEITPLEKLKGKLVSA